MDSVDRGDALGGGIFFAMLIMFIVPILFGIIIWSVFVIIDLITKEDVQIKWILAIWIAIIQIFICILIAHVTLVVIFLMLSMCAGLFIKFADKTGTKRKKEIAFGLSVGTILSIATVSFFLVMATYFLGGDSNM